MNDFRDYEYIEHHGVKGMHWGIRRYQNKDGSLTPVGKRKYEDAPIDDKSRKKQLDRLQKISINSTRSEQQKPVTKLLLKKSIANLKTERKPID